MKISGFFLNNYWIRKTHSRYVRKPCNVMKLITLKYDERNVLFLVGNEVYPDVLRSFITVSHYGKYIIQ